MNCYILAKNQINMFSYNKSNNKNKIKIIKFIHRLKKMGNFLLHFLFVSCLLLSAFFLLVVCFFSTRSSCLSFLYKLLLSSFFCFVFSMGSYSFIYCCFFLLISISRLYKVLLLCFYLMFLLGSTRCSSFLLLYSIFYTLFFCFYLFFLLDSTPLLLILLRVLLISSMGFFWLLVVCFFFSPRTS